ncbi:hypothetical protein BBJ28_00026859 [Nothophytophthora sp. Chile5]|nr:hypothetical protein BBJ28_00026859 [Nothophytophthora sp. Chile5]
MHDTCSPSVQALGIPAHMLPVVKAPGAIVGQSSNLDTLLGLPNGIPVYLPMGDHPCSVMAAISQTQNLADGILSRTSVLNISSTTQLAMVLTSEDAVQLNSSMHEDGSNSPSFEVRPFLFDNWFLGVAASLSGYQAMYARLISLGGTKLDTDLEFLPTLNGEWAAPAMRGRIQQLCMANWSVGDISAAICRGLLDNIFAMVPDELRTVLPSQPMIGAGRAMVHNALLQHFLAEKLEHPTQLTIQDAADAAVGVAFAPSLLQK